MRVEAQAMAHLNRILVPVDFSHNSATAALHASALARRFHSEVTLLHVTEFLAVHPLNGPLGFGITSSEAERAEHMARRRKDLDAFGIAEFSGIPVKRIVCSGDPALVIVARAQAEKSDLILMPTHGRGAFRRFLLGSITAKVLHDADCPVFTGTHLTGALFADLNQLRHVMCAVTLNRESIPVIQWSADFASAFGAALTVVHALWDPPPGLPRDYVFQWHEQTIWAAKEQLERLLADSKVQASILVAGGRDEIPATLSAAAREKDAGVLVIGRGRAHHAAKNLGDRAYAIICHSPCPVVRV
jgi:nucleotide-binding universal stress UspA family protein